MEPMPPPELTVGPPKRDPVRGKIAFTVHADWELHLPQRPSPKKKWPLVVAFHGMSQRSRTFASIIDPILSDGRAVLVPEGPHAHETPDGDKRREGRAWYIFTGDQDAFLKSARATAESVWALVDRLVAEFPIDPKRISLLGYSQGGYLAGIMAIESQRKLIAAVLLASRLKDECIKKDGASKKKKSILPPFYLVHGDRDKIVPVEYALAAATRAKALGATVFFETFPGGHRPTPEEFAAIDRFLSDREWPPKKKPAARAPKKSVKRGS